MLYQHVANVKYTYIHIYIKLKEKKPSTTGSNFVTVMTILMKMQTKPLTLNM